MFRTLLPTLCSYQQISEEVLKGRNDSIFLSNITALFRNLTLPEDILLLPCFEELEHEVNKISQIPQLEQFLLLAKDMIVNSQNVTDIAGDNTFDKVLKKTEEDVPEATARFPAIVSIFSNYRQHSLEEQR